MKRLFLLLLLFLAACSSAPKNFDDAVSLIQNLDEKYNASFTQESIPDRLVALENISPYISELRKINSTIDYSGEDGVFASYLIQGRIEMLESERYFLLANEIGSEGFVRFNFTCKQVPNIVQASDYFFNTVSHAYSSF